MILPSSRELSDLGRKNNMPMCLCGCKGVARDTYNFYRDIVMLLKELNEEKKMPKIVTQYVYPPIPIRDFDWCAFFDGEDGDEDGLRGWGYTEEEAIAALMEITDD